MKIYRISRLYLFIAISIQLLAGSCTTVDLYEKSVAIPGHAWTNSFHPSFEFTIKDTTSPYQVYFILRHTEKYKYTNIYVNLFVQVPGQDSVIKIQRDLLLATSEKGWLGKGMDDIYDHRIALGAPERLKAGNYKFTVEQIMRDNPLLHVLNAGIRVEKKQ